MRAYISENVKTNQVQAYYKINLQEKESSILSRIQAFFGGVGYISSYTAGARLTCVAKKSYRIANRSNLVNTVIPYFTNYPLIGIKLYHFKAELRAS